MNLLTLSKIIFSNSFNFIPKHLKNLWNIPCQTVQVFLNQKTQQHDKFVSHSINLIKKKMKQKREKKTVRMSGKRSTKESEM